MLLRYSVTSRVRRELLRLLWAEGAKGSVSELARAARVSFAAAHRELDAMQAEGLAVSERAGNRLVYRTNPAHPRASLIRSLVQTIEHEPVARGTQAQDERVRSWLRAAGAPIGASEPDRLPTLEQLVAAGVALAHRDATVALVLPVVLWRQRDYLDYDRLANEATRLNERHALGFYLELTGQLGGDRRLVSAARPLRDKRCTRPRLFFAKPHGRYALVAAGRNTPPVARKWGYRMNMPLDSFASAFSKHRGTA